MTDEERVARVLDGLRRAEPLPGMKARVLERMLAERQHEAATQGTGPWWRRPLWPDIAPQRKMQAAWAVAGVAGMLLLGGGVLWRMPRTPSGAGSPAQVQRKFPESGQNEASYAVPAHTLQAGTATVTTARTPGPAHDRQRLGFAKVALRRPPSALARNDAIESFPAPPLPLTRQERLLLRILEGGEKGELVATLAPGHEDALRQKELQEFSTFFRPASPSVAEPPPRDTGLDQTTSTDSPQ